MQQRQPRLGDVVDDYCPRERRVTNHAVVAMVGDDIKQTRCNTCDAEHEYKHARVPPQRRKKEVPGAIYQQVLEGLPRVVPPDGPLDEEPAGPLATPIEAEPEPVAQAVAAEAATDVEHDGPVHRRLIRATLPRLGNETPARREPEFTMRAPAPNRHGKPKNGFRGGGQRASGGPDHSAGQPNGNRTGKRHGRPGGNGQGSWGRPGPAATGGRPGGGQRRGRGKKRSR